MRRSRDDLEARVEARTETQLMRAIYEAMTDTTWFSRSVMEKLAQLRSGSADPTPVGELIATELGLAVQTVRNDST